MNVPPPGALTHHLEKLRLFAAVARAGSFHAASAELRLTQPSVSRAVMALEGAAGARLFERSRAGVRLTPEGRLLLEFCERLEAQLADVEQRLRHPESPRAGVLQIGTFETLSFYLWPQLLRELRQEAAALTIRLVGGSEDELRERLLAGQLQLVVEAEPRLDERVRSVVLFRDSFAIYGSAEVRTPTALEAAPITYVARARDEAGLSIRELLLAQGIAPERLAYELDTFSSAQQFALAGLGVAVLPQRLARQQLREGKLREAKLPGLPARGFGRHRICASHLEENHTDPRIRLVLARLRAFA